MPSGLADMLGSIFTDRRPPFVREGLGRMTGEGQRGGPPRVTHGGIPGANRAEKRSNANAAHRAAVIARRGR